MTTLYVYRERGYVKGSQDPLEILFFARNLLSVDEKTTLAGGFSKVK